MSKTKAETKEEFDVYTRGLVENQKESMPIGGEKVTIHRHESFDVVVTEGNDGSVNVLVERQGGFPSVTNIPATNKESPFSVDDFPKLKPTKIEYVKCEFNHAWEAVKAFEESETFYTDDAGDFEVSSAVNLVSMLMPPMGGVYRT